MKFNLDINKKNIFIFFILFSLIVISSLSLVVASDFKFNNNYNFINNDNYDVEDGEIKVNNHVGTYNGVDFEIVDYELFTIDLPVGTNFTHDESKDFFRENNGTYSCTYNYPNTGNDSEKFIGFTYFSFSQDIGDFMVDDVKKQFDYNETILIENNTDYQIYELTTESGYYLVKYNGFEDNFNKCLVIYCDGSDIDLMRQSIMSVEFNESQSYY